MRVSSCGITLQLSLISFGVSYGSMESAAAFLLFDTLSVYFFDLSQQFVQTSSFPPILSKFLHKVPCTVMLSFP